MKYENKRLTVSVGKTINLGNYESIKVHAGISVDVKDKADLEAAYNDLFDECNEQILMYENHHLTGDK